MLLRSQVKTPIILLLILSTISFICIIGAISLSATWKYIGFMMQSSTFTGCSYYLTLKLQTVNRYIYNIIFICSCLSASIMIGIIVYFIILLIKYADGQQNSQKQFPHFSQTTFYIFYILYSIAIILVIPGVGYYLTFIVEKGYYCTSNYNFDWFIIGGLLATALVFLLISWIYLLIFRIKSEEAFQQKPQIIQQKPQIIQPTMKQMLDQMILRQKIKKEQSIKQIKEPLLQEVDEQDRVSQQNVKEKIVFVGFEQYKKHQQRIKQKEKQQEQLIQQFIIKQMYKKAQKDRDRQQQKMKKQKQQEMLKRIKSQQLSPKDENSNIFFQESQRNNKNFDNSANIQQILNKPPQSPKQQFFYPANYVPIDEQDQKKYTAYKKSILQRIKPKNNINRHPQNVEGGRSKKKLQKIILRQKRPQRNQQMYKRRFETPINTSVIDVSESSQDDAKSANFNILQQKKQQPLDNTIFTPQQNANEPQYQRNQEEKVHKVIQIKQRTKSIMRKKLFQETNKAFDYQSATSILGSLFKKVIKQNKLEEKQRKLNSQDSNDPKYIKRKTEKLIDSIRSKFN